MKFAIITHATHKVNDNKIYAYEPYIKEMNLWLQFVKEVKIVAPIINEEITVVESNYSLNNLEVDEIPLIDALTFKNKIISFLKLPYILYKIFKAMLWADHIHLRCPGNIGLLGCFVQIFFPTKNKTVKYAGNWDPNSKQPISYCIQKWIISNTFLTRNCKVLVYGNWENQSKNIIPFFTASYSKNEIISLPNKNTSALIKFIYVGTFSKGKQPLLSVKTIQKLHHKGYEVQLNMYGNGSEYYNINNFIKENNLDEVVFLKGNQPKEIVKKAYQESHFLIFISKSEGWPKVVAEAMFWKCLPISSKVSCVNYMLDNSKRGSVLKSDVNENEVVSEILYYLNNEDIYQKKVLEALTWSQKYTLDKFELEIKKILNN